MMPNDLTSGHTKTRNVTSLVLVLLPLMMFLLASLQIILASPSDKWDENIRPILVTDYLKDKNAGKKIKAIHQTIFSDDKIYFKFEYQHI